MPLDLAEAISLPPEEAIRWFRAKGYVISWNWQDTLAEANARAFTVAKVAELDVLTAIRQTLDQAIAEGKTERWFQNTLTPVLQKAGWWGVDTDPRDATGQTRIQLGSPRRLSLIYRQNMQAAYMAGRWQEQLRLREARPYLQYVAVLDARTRDSHRALNGRVYRFDDPIWRTHYPPNGWGCRCRVRQLSEFALRRRGLTVSSSEGELSTKTVAAGRDAYTGEITRTEVTGVRVLGRDGRPETFFTDPGFSYNLGPSAFMPDLDRYAPDIAKQYVQGVVTGPEFERWFSIWQRAVAADTAGLSNAGARAALRDQRVRPGQDAAKDALGFEGSVPELAYPVAVLRAEDMAALQTRSRTVQLSTTSLKEHLAAHPEIGLADYQLLQKMVDQGEVYAQDDRRIILLSEQGKLYRASLKVDEARRGVYLLSLIRTNKEIADAQVRSLPRVR